MPSSPAKSRAAKRSVRLSRAISASGFSGGVERRRAGVGGFGHVLVNRAYARLESGDFAGAEADGLLMIDLKPEDVDALLNRAEARAKLGRKAEAKGDCEAVLRLEPGNRDALKMPAELG